MSQLEDDHWWYRGLRDLLRRTLRNSSSAIPDRPRILDIGCGTGANLKMLAEHFKKSELSGFDISPLAVELAKRKCPSADIYVDDIRSPSLRADCFDLILSCDALYVPGLRSSLAGIQQTVQRLADGGLLILHLPAYQWLYSQHDQAMGTTERYSMRQVDALLATLGLRCETISYRVSTIFPLIVAKRAPQWIRKRKVAEPRSDLAMPPDAINRLLFWILQRENVAISRQFALPFGSSLFAVGRKP